MDGSGAGVRGAEGLRRAARGIHAWRGSTWCDGSLIHAMRGWMGPVPGCGGSTPRCARYPRVAWIYAVRWIVDPRPAWMDGSGAGVQGAVGLRRAARGIHAWRGSTRCDGSLIHAMRGWMGPEPGCGGSTPRCARYPRMAWIYVRWIVDPRHAWMDGSGAGVPGGAYRCGVMVWVGRRAGGAGLGTQIATPAARFCVVGMPIPTPPPTCEP
ncbi:hypothetical protein D3C87_571130 [compost metagenome]